MRVCIIGISGKLGRYMAQHCLDRGWEVTGVCRAKSVDKLADFGDRITVLPGPTNDASVVAQAVEGCDAVLTVLVPWGRKRYAEGTARAVMEHATRKARLVFSCGWHITRDGKDEFSRMLRFQIRLAHVLGFVLRVIDLGDQERATQAVFDSGRRWTMVRGSDLEEGPAEGLPIWRDHVHDPALESNRTRRIDFARFMVEAIENDDLIQQAPAICSRESESAKAHPLPRDNR